MVVAAIQLQLQFTIVHVRVWFISWWLQLYNEKDIDRCIARMEAVDFKQKTNVDGG